MANYAYKDVCYSVPEKYIEAFEEEHGREFNGDSNYDGDYWIVVGNWINDLQSELSELKSKAAGEE